MGIQAGALLERLRTQALHFFKHAQSALNHQAQLPPRAPGYQVHQGSAAGHQSACVLHAVGNERLLGTRGSTVAHSGCIGTVLLHPCLWEIAAPARQIHAAVLPKINQLQGGTDGVTVGKCLRAVHVVQVQQQASHRVGRAAAIVQQVGFVVVAHVERRHLHILHKGVEQIEQKTT